MSSPTRIQFEICFRYKAVLPPMEHSLADFIRMLRMILNELSQQRGLESRIMPEAVNALYEFYQRYFSIQFTSFARMFYENSLDVWKSLSNAEDDDSAEI